MSITELGKKNVKLLAWLLILFVFSFLIWKVFGNSGKRYIMYFESADSSVVLQESRYIRSITGKSAVETFVEELLLGPQTERCKPLFASGTHVLSCFQQDTTLYVNLSKDLLQESAETVAIKEGTKLFQNNIRKNFVNIKEIEMYADGIRMYEMN